MVPEPLVGVRNHLCQVVEVPEGVAPERLGAYGSEGFGEWVRRRCGDWPASWDCRIIGSSGRVFLVAGDLERAGMVSEAHFKGSAGGSIEFEHPVLAPSAVRLPDGVTDRSEEPAWLDGGQTNSYRDQEMLDDCFRNWTCSRLGTCLLYQSERPPSAKECEVLEVRGRARGMIAGYWKRHERAVQEKDKQSLCPQRVWGDPETRVIQAMEEGVAYELRFDEGYSFGLFLDQRENRWRVRWNRIAPGFAAWTADAGGSPLVLNTFAYTCGFSVCAALAGATVFSVDLSRKYLDWGKRNFLLNHLDPDAHSFLYGDVFGWLKRFRRRGQQFDLVILDPPTFSRSKEWGPFQVVRDLGKLVDLSVSLVRPGGRILVSSNALRWEPARFVEVISSAVERAGRKIGRQCFATQPWDFGRVSASEAYLKTWWLELK